MAELEVPQPFKERLAEVASAEVALEAAFKRGDETCAGKLRAFMRSEEVLALIDVPSRLQAAQAAAARGDLASAEQLVKEAAEIVEVNGSTLVSMRWRSDSAFEESNRILDHLINGDSLPFSAFTASIGAELASSGYAVRRYGVGRELLNSFLQELELPLEQQSADLLLAFATRAFALNELCNGDPELFGIVERRYGAPPRDLAKTACANVIHKLRAELQSPTPEESTAEISYFDSAFADYFLETYFDGYVTVLPELVAISESQGKLSAAAYFANAHLERVGPANQAAVEVCRRIASAALQAGDRKAATVAAIALPSNQECAKILLNASRSLLNVEPEFDYYEQGGDMGVMLAYSIAESVRPLVIGRLSLDSVVSFGDPPVENVFGISERVFDPQPHSALPILFATIGSMALSWNEGPEVVWSDIMLHFEADPAFKLVVRPSREDVAEGNGPESVTLEALRAIGEMATEDSSIQGLQRDLYYLLRAGQIEVHFNTWAVVERDFESGAVLSVEHICRQGLPAEETEAALVRTEESNLAATPSVYSAFDSQATAELTELYRKAVVRQGINFKLVSAAGSQRSF
ncbi:MAG: hypothetical protein J0M12_06625 [Deltaproteobacteria bacterium]|nr:hypothetical protein [Deltaproteobacteria bacterium]